MRTIKINNESFEVSEEITSFAAGVEALEASAKALPPEQAAESKRALDAIKAHRAELKAKADAKAKAEAAKTTTTEGAK